MNSILAFANPRLGKVTEIGTSLSYWDTKEKACNYSAFSGSENAAKACKAKGFVFSLRSQTNSESWEEGKCLNCKSNSSKEIKCSAEGSVGCIDANFKKVFGTSGYLMAATKESACNRAKSAAKSNANEQCSNGAIESELLKQPTNAKNECRCTAVSDGANQFSCSSTYNTTCKFVPSSDLTVEEVRAFVEKVQIVREKNEEVREIIASDKLQGYDKTRAEVSVTASDKYLDESENNFNKGDAEFALELLEMATELTDLALGFTPGVSIGKDIYEAILGQRLVDGELLSEEARAFAAIGALTFGVGSKFKPLLGILKKANVDVMSKIGLKTGGFESVTHFVETVVKELGNSGKNYLEKFTSKFTNYIRNSRSGIASEDVFKEMESVTTKGIGSSEKYGEFSPFKVSFMDADHIGKNLTKRGWTHSQVGETVNKPYKTFEARDTRKLKNGQRVNEPAKAYMNEDGSYVVRNETTGDIVQINNKNDTEWLFPTWHPFTKK